MTVRNAATRGTRPQVIPKGAQSGLFQRVARLQQDNAAGLEKTRVNTAPVVACGEMSFVLCHFT